MTDNQIKLLKEALLEEDLREMAIIDSLPDEEFVFSEKYKKEMQKLLNKHKKHTPTANRFIPKRLVGVLVAILITLTLMMSISAIRKPIIKFIVNIYEEFISIFIEDEGAKSPETIEKTIIPSYIIDGYHMKDITEKATFSILIWENDIGEKIQLKQYILKDGLQAFLDAENSTYSLLSTHLNKDLFYSNKNTNLSIVWSDNIYLYNLLCPSTIEITEIEKIIESMEVVED